MRRTWLGILSKPVPGELETPSGIAAFEAAQVCPDVRFALREDWGESYSLEKTGDAYAVTGGTTGVLYGAYALIRAIAAGEPLPEGRQTPYYPLRMLDCWDNMDGTIERGYSGRSLWFEDDEFSYDPERIRQLGRMLASVGINVLCINNVNVHQPAQHLTDSLLPEVKKLAAILRPFGVRLMLSIDFSQPMQNGLDTSDPLDPRVEEWWTEHAEKVWQEIPDLAGFLVKADSEHRPGPSVYGRTHAQGANMLARAVAPFGGKIVWRAFVYNCLQDWRDTTTDRPCAAYDLYHPQDGSFDNNVILQIKYGPYDFQVREPLSPLFLGMPRTSIAMEMQLAQEYTGHQIDVYAMAPMWRELLDQAGKEKLSALVAVGNLGRDDNWTGHPFAAVNLFCFGLFAWDPDCDPETAIRLWERLTYNLPADQEETFVSMLMNSRHVYEQYTAPLGLCWMVRPDIHYGPSPYGYEFQLWGTYNRADRDAVGIDRTKKGTGFTEQYPKELAQLYADPEKCPDELLLFFHRLPYDWKMRDGRTLIQRIYDDHFDGCAAAEKMYAELKTLSIPEPDRTEALQRMERQVRNAREWRDVTNTFFHRFSGAPDAHGRRIYA
ncbi:MAG: alpha-glucuronidase [Clostridia bacterium]|nr:alpha-glucuronidase [Clostridia bacterium]